MIFFDSLQAFNFEFIYSDAIGQNRLLNFVGNYRKQQIFHTTRTTYGLLNSEDKFSTYILQIIKYLLGKG